MRRTLAGALVPCMLVAGSAAATTSQHFESPQVHPVDMSPDGTRLFVAHTAGQEIAVFDLTAPSGPVRIATIPVGYAPVTVRARTDNEIWVVNHVSDAVSIVDLGAQSVVKTLLPGDEPTDVVFAEAQSRAFVCLSQEDRIAAYDLTNLDLAPTSIPLDQSDPRSLALSPDGSTLYVAALDSQNNTTIIPWQPVNTFGGPPPPNPPMDPALPTVPLEGLIVKNDGTNWVDETGAVWPIPYTLLDNDVIEISTSTLAVTGQFHGVGTTLFNLGVNPVSGRLYVTNQEAFNEIRFVENLVGKFAQNRITLIDPGSATVTPVHLNQHINYANPPGDPTERAMSLAIPTDVAVSSDGNTVYVAAMGSGKVGVLDTDGNVTRRIPVGRGPTGLALDETRNRLYVVDRFTSTLSVVDLTDDSSYELPLGFDPSTQNIINARDFLYGAETSSAHGDLACATCHVFGKTDGIAWDLGDPLGTWVDTGLAGGSGYHPMKGPMMTQALAGLQGTGPFHWRGDFATLADFNTAFTDVLGRSSQLTTNQMNSLTTFLQTIEYPPNPFRNLDDTMPSVMPNGGDPNNGENLFLTAPLVNNGGVTCADCHTPGSGTRGTLIPASNVEGNQDMLIPHLRDLYEKTRFTSGSPTSVRGYGFLHDGAFANLFDYFQLPLFKFTNNSDILDVEAYITWGFNEDVSPAVGAQWTLDGTTSQARVDTLEAQAAQNAIGLIAKGRDGSGETRGWVRLSNGKWASDRTSELNLTYAELTAIAGPGTEITFTGVLKGEEVRLGVDRDDDGWRDRDELDAGSDPEDPNSTPGSVVGVPAITGTTGELLWLAGGNPARSGSRLGFQIVRDGPARLDVYDVAGRRVRTLLQSPNEAAGRYERVWDLADGAGRRVAAGVYFVRLRTADGSAGERVVVLK